MINSSVELRGWVHYSAVLKPQPGAAWYDDLTKYRIKIYPESPHDYEIIADKVEAMKLQNPVFVNPDVVEAYENRDMVFEKQAICFETLHKPKLSKEIKDLEHDDKLIGCAVAVTANVQLLPDGNAYLSPHLISLIPDDSPDVEEMDGCDDDW